RSFSPLSTITPGTSRIRAVRSRANSPSTSIGAAAGLAARGGPSDLTDGIFGAVGRGAGGATQAETATRRANVEVRMRIGDLRAAKVAISFLLPSRPLFDPGPMLL